MYAPSVPLELPEGRAGPPPAGRGAFTFMLHSHLPYVRENGMWPHGEEWLYEALAETYLPLLDTVAGLAEAGIRGGLTIGLTPILCEQLADALVLERSASYLVDRQERAARDEARFGEAARTGRLAAAEGGIGFGGGGGAIGSEDARTFARLAAWYAARYGALATALDGRWKRDVVGASSVLHDEASSVVVRAVKDCRLLALEGADLLEIAPRDSELHQALKRVSSQRRTRLQ